MHRLLVLLSAFFSWHAALAADRFYASTDRAALVLVNATEGKLEELASNGQRTRVCVFIDSRTRERLYVNLYLAALKDADLLGIDSAGSCYQIDVRELSVSRNREIGFLTTPCHDRLGVSPVLGVASDGSDTCYVSVGEKGIAVYDFDQKKIRQWLPGIKADSCFGLALWDGGLYALRPAPSPGAVLQVTSNEIVQVNAWRNVPVFTQQASLAAAPGGNIYLFDAGRLRCLSNSSLARVSYEQASKDEGFLDPFWQEDNGNNKDSGYAKDRGWAKDGFAKDGFSKDGDIPVPGEESEAPPPGTRLPGLQDNIISFAPVRDGADTLVTTGPDGWSTFGNYFLSGFGSGGFTSIGSAPGSPSSASSSGYESSPPDQKPLADSPRPPGWSDTPPSTEPTPPWTEPTPPWTEPTPPGNGPTPPPSESPTPRNGTPPPWNGPEPTPVPETSGTTMLVIMLGSFALFLAIRRFRPA